MQDIFITSHGTTPFEEMSVQGEKELLQIAPGTRQPQKQSLGEKNYKISWVEEEKLTQKF